MSDDYERGWMDGFREACGAPSGPTPIDCARGHHHWDKDGECEMACGVTSQLSAIEATHRTLLACAAKARAKAERCECRPDVATTNEAKLLHKGAELALLALAEEFEREAGNG